jgi:hypothetical protein
MLNLVAMKTMMSKMIECEILKITNTGKHQQSHPLPSTQTVTKIKIMIINLTIFQVIFLNFN